MNGGEGGLRQWLNTLGAQLEKGWELLGRPPMDEDTLATLIAQADDAFGDRSYAELVRARDTRQNAVLRALAAVDAEEVPAV
ncbi:hypothetical protein [Streptomyces sp.]|uniref:hypothetical protein n=1 Tax=Streptomyces sp. TaxID=1931 RepID=UPI002811ACAE|nr:hypothetical protein [Streptomyces sp.]